MKTETLSQYDQQAEQFLTKHGIKFRATLSDSKPPSWAEDGENHGHHYRVTLSKAKREHYHKSDRITFDFWASIADMEAGIQTVTPYDVLACISSDATVPETFKEFCGEFGYEEDSIKALQMFRRCAGFGKRLRAFFTTEELEALQQIDSWYSGSLDHQPPFVQIARSALARYNAAK